MKLRKVLIVYKKSTFQIQAVERRESRFIRLLEEGHDSVTRVKVAHAEHYDVLDTLKSILTDRGIEVKALARADLNRTVKNVDLVISVGGDGTFLDASHFLDVVPLLGVNSSKSSSFGHFCLANETNLAATLDQIENDQIEPLKLLRLELELNGELLPELVLNEVLICHSNPAGTSRYFLQIDQSREEQRSGGIWIGPPGGSTGAIKAAAGTVLPIAERNFQYIVREPGPRPYESWSLLRGLLSEDTEIKITSQMRTGSLYIDGQHIDYGFGLGDELTVRVSKKNLISYVAPDVNDIFQKK